MTTNTTLEDRLKALAEQALEDHALDCRQNPGDDQWDPICEVEPGDLLTLLSALQSERLRAEELHGALTKIDAIRNSIVGCQRVNWSEHIYPLVAVLGEVGFEGQDYESARENVGTLIDRANSAEFLLALMAAAAEASREDQGESQATPVRHGDPCPMRPEGQGDLEGGEEFLEFKEALSDLRSLRHEYECLNGGGPGWSARNAAAWARVNELFANEDEAAWHRQQEDAHG